MSTSGWAPSKSASAHGSSTVFTSLIPKILEHEIPLVRSLLDGTGEGPLARTQAGRRLDFRPISKPPAGNVAISSREGLGFGMDWRIKLATQFVLAHVPLGRNVNYLLQILNGRHAASVARGRIPQLAADLSRISQSGLDLEESRVVEIGTGWNAINTLLLFVLGAKEIHTYDRTRHLRLHLVQRALREIEISIEEVAARTTVPVRVLRERLAHLSGKQQLEEILNAGHIHYHAPGDATRTGLAEASVDLVYSYGVLEHVPAEIAHRFNQESRRILRPGGLVFHGIGLHDHYTGVDRNITAVNFLKYSDRFWSTLVLNDISYHNRLRERDFVDIFRRDGFELLHRESSVDPASLHALESMRVDERFRGYTKEELAVIRTVLILKAVTTAVDAPATQTSATASPASRVMQPA